MMSRTGNSGFREPAEQMAMSPGRDLSNLYRNGGMEVTYVLQ